MVKGIAKAKRGTKPSKSNTGVRTKHKMAGGRTALDKAKKAGEVAKGKNTNLIRYGLSFSRPIGSLADGQKLKKSILGMGARLNIDTARMEMLKKMDPRYLQGLYEQNDILFEVYFDYDGIKYHDAGYYTIEDDKTSQVDLLIIEYQRVFGAL